MKASLIILLLVLLGLGLCLFAIINSPSIPQKSDTPPKEYPPIDEKVLSAKVNDYRAAEKLSKLPENEKLCKYAEIRATQIQKSWTHNAFYNDHCSGSDYLVCGENLARDYYTEDALLQGWKDSPTHDKNLKANWSAMCIKCNNRFCAQEFGM